MFIWQILILLSSLLALISGLVEGGTSGGVGVCVGLVVGLIVAVASWFGLGIFGLFIKKRARLGTEPVTRWQAPAYLFMYAYPVAWTFIARWLVVSITRFVIHHGAS